MESIEGPTTYDPVGACIYCGTCEGQLTREHIIPLGLGGNWVLPQASCNACAAITRDIEQFCLRPMLGPFRIRLKLPTRRPKERPATLPIEYVRTDGERERSSVPSEQFPGVCFGFRWPAPGLLRGQPPTENFEGDLVVRYIESEMRVHATPDRRKVKLGAINMLLFARMLAKIAHSYAVANLGLNAFTPLLPDLILGKSAVAPWLVGGDTSGSVPATQQDLHSVYLQNCMTAGVEYTLVAVRLFGFVGMPRYHVVVGKVGRKHAVQDGLQPTAAGAIMSHRG
jgi:hypothetical protein